MKSKIQLPVFCWGLLLILFNSGLSKKIYTFLSITAKQSILFILFCLNLMAVFAEDKTPPKKDQLAIQGIAKLYTNLYAVLPDGTQSLADGITNSYAVNYHDCVDEQDALKLISFNNFENISILREGKKLSIERRLPIISRDTTFLEIAGMSGKTYMLKFIAQNFNPLLVAGIKDEFTGTISPINLSMTDTTKYFFDVSDAAPASKFANRFLIVFAPLGELPVNFRSVKAFEQNSAISVEWKVENEINVQQYNIEKSYDGINFRTVAIKQLDDVTNTSGIYTWVDPVINSEINYYRIANVNMNGSIAYSKIVRLTVADKKIASVNAYPTFITDGNFSVQFNNVAKGLYKLRLMHMNGQLLMEKTIHHSGGNATETIRIDKNISKGIYQLRVTGTMLNSFPVIQLINQ